VTKDNLVRRGVIRDESSHCVGGCGSEESVTHLFFECPFLQESGILFVIGWEYFQHFRMSVWLTLSNSKV
jgi:hypothetical protein